MDLKFDTDGYLTPQKNISTTWDIFYQTFKFNEYRESLLRILEDYLNDFSNQITTKFTVWIDGSFVTKKQRPNDIDFILFVDHQIVETLQSSLDNFLGKGIFVPKELDVYIVKVYPDTHQEYEWFIEQQKYWIYTFTKIKHRYKKQINKGFIEIEFQNNE